MRLTKSWKLDVIGGVTTFFTMAYIVVVNPSILATPGTGLPFAGVLTATVVLASSMSLVMGLYARLPFAVAPGMGMNAFVAFTLILGKKIPWPVAMGMVCWAGALFLVLSILPVRKRVAEAIPQGLRGAAAVGIGIFLTFIGLKNAGLVVADPVTLVRLGSLDKKCLLSLAGLFVTILFVKRKNPFAFLIGIGLVTLAGWFLGLVHVPETIFSRPDFSTFFRADLRGALNPAFFSAIVAICFTDFFDSISTFVGVSKATRLVDENNHPKNLKEGLLVDALATFTAGAFGTSPGTAYIESTSGIEAGGRTGRASVVTALCFLPCLFVAPLAGMVPAYATAPVLILVGALLFKNVVDLDLKHWEDLIPIFLTIVLIPLTFSITQGILWGFLSHVFLYAVAGRRKEIDPVMYGISAVAALLLYLENG